MSYVPFVLRQAQDKQNYYWAVNKLLNRRSVLKDKTGHDVGAGTGTRPYVMPCPLFRYLLKYQ